MNQRRIVGLCACVMAAILAAGPLGAVSVEIKKVHLPLAAREHLWPTVLVRPLSKAFPAGSSVSFDVQSPHPDPSQTGYAFSAAGLPPGVQAEFMARPTPYDKTLVLHTPPTLAPGDYSFRVFAQLDALSWVSQPVGLHVTECQPFRAGEYTENIQSNLVGLITAGKPNYEHGLLVPLQICAPTPLTVTLLQVIAEDGSTMADPPPFYLYRSLDWPAPAEILAHYPYGPNVELPRVDAVDWRLEADLRSGLYLLIFERDHYGSSADPHDIPARVTYRLE